MAQGDLGFEAAPALAHWAPQHWAVAAGWQGVVDDFLASAQGQRLSAFLQERLATGTTVYPPQPFRALELTPLASVRAVILGQDPYHGPGQAHGLCFSVKPGVTAPPSLKNMYKELKTDLGCRVPNHGYLVPWAQQGILMINAVLTVRAHTPNSHKDRGWERFTDAIIEALNEREAPCVFVLWGGYAQKKAKLITGSQHLVLKAAHPRARRRRAPRARSGPR